MAGALASLTLALACLSAVAAAREDPFVQQKTYAPPYGSGGSPVTPTPDVPYSPTPSGGSPLVPTPDVPYSPTPSGGSPVVPTPDVPYTPSPYVPTPVDPAPTTPAPATSGTCKWWSKNTSSFPDIISIITTLVDLLSSTSGSAGGTSTPSIGSIFGNQMTVFQGLTNTRNDGYGALARQGSAAILNAYSNRQYAYSAQQVRMQFKSALGNQQSAFQMARVFENANNALGMRH